MSIVTIIAIVFAVVVLAAVGYAIRYNSLMKSAKRAMRKASFWEDMAEISGDRIETYEEYSKARRAYRKAARLYLSAGEYSKAKFAVMKSVEMNKLYEKYLYM